MLGCSWSPLSLISLSIFLCGLGGGDGLSGWVGMGLGGDGSGFVGGWGVGMVCFLGEVGELEPWGVGGIPRV